MTQNYHYDQTENRRQASLRRCGHPSGFTHQCDFIIWTIILPMYWFFHNSWRDTHCSKIQQSPLTWLYSVHFIIY